jgi:hypothetical protein
MRFQQAPFRTCQISCLCGALIGLATHSAAQTNGSAKGTSANSSGLNDHQLVLKARALAATQNFLNLIQRHAAESGVDPALVMAVMTVESDGDPNSVSSSGAMGLMQLMPEICSDYSVQNPFDPDANIRGGVALLASHSRRYKGDLQKVLAAYNAGPRHADDGSWVFITQTKRYVPTVLAYYAALKGSVDSLVPFQDEPPVTIPVPDPDKFYPPAPRYEDIEFAALRTSQNIADPASLAENGDLADAASALLSDYLEGKVTQKNLQAKALKGLRLVHRTPKTLKAYCLTTPGPSDFSTEWDKQAPVAGNLMGAAHADKKSYHVWVVLVAQF